MAKHDDVVSLQFDVSRNGQETSEERLVRAFNELKDELTSTLVFVLGNREDAKDAAQDAFIKCWNAREQLPQVINLRAWIFRVCFNTAKDMQRRLEPQGKALKEQYTMTGLDAAPSQTLAANRSAACAAIRPTRGGNSLPAAAERAPM